MKLSDYFEELERESQKKKVKEQLDLMIDKKKQQLNENKKEGMTLNRLMEALTENTPPN